MADVVAIDLASLGEFSSQLEALLESHKLLCGPP